MFGDGLRIASNGGIETDVFLKTSRPDVYAAGDCASYPYWVTGESVRVEHHNEAIQQGFVAAMNMLNRPTPMESVPFFWTNQYNQGLRYSGVGQKYDELIIDGEISENKFIAYYCRDGKVVASASMGVPRVGRVSDLFMGRRNKSSTRRCG